MNDKTRSQQYQRNKIMNKKLSDIKMETTENESYWNIETKQAYCGECQMFTLDYEFSDMCSDRISFNCCGTLFCFNSINDIPSRDIATKK